MAAISEKINEELNNLLKDIPEIKGVVLLSIDGLVVGKSGVTESEAEKVAGISAALWGMSRRVTGFLKGEKSLEVVLKMNIGYLNLYSTKEGRAIMAVFTSQNANLGLVNIKAREVVEKVSPLLE